MSKTSKDVLDRIDVIHVKAITELINSCGNLQTVSEEPTSLITATTDLVELNAFFAAEGMPHVNIIYLHVFRTPKVRYSPICDKRRQVSFKLTLVARDSPLLNTYAIWLSDQMWEWYRERSKRESKRDAVFKVVCNKVWTYLALLSNA
jgi:hypothetical protein